MSLFELLLEVRGFSFSSAVDEFARIRSLSPDDFIGWQKDRSIMIANYHLRNNEFYRSIAGISEVRQWDDLPFLKKGDFQRPLTDLLSLPARKRQHSLYVSSTSGSSGHPFFFAKDKFSHGLTWASIAYWYERAGLRLSSPQGRLYGVPKSFLDRSFEHLKDRVMDRIRLPVYDLSDGAFNKFLESIQAREIEFIYGYTSAIVLFAEFLKRKGIVCAEYVKSLRSVIVTSETCGAYDKLIIEQQMGVPVFIEYGASELGLLAFGNSLESLECVDELFLFEQLDGPDGLPEIVCTSLFNTAFPLIRYRLGDLVTLSKHKGRSVITSLQGRTNDVIRFPSGKIAAGFSFYYISRSLLERYGVLMNEFRVRQTRLDHFVFDVVAKRHLSRSEEEIIAKTVCHYLGEEFSVEFRYVTEIPTTPSMKLRHFVSEIHD
ncbi:MAG: phenylacetate--CoA ligase family protein [Cyclobacteriaceae bacterium]|nr:phenylacetate--CoA ligase family protein [Cyclobacteriaceae bacterium]